MKTSKVILALTALVLAAAMLLSACGVKDDSKTTAAGTSSAGEPAMTEEPATEEPTTELPMAALPTLPMIAHTPRLMAGDSCAEATGARPMEPTTSADAAPVATPFRRREMVEPVDEGRIDIIDDLCMSDAFLRNVCNYLIRSSVPQTQVTHAISPLPPP